MEFTWNLLPRFTTLKCLQINDLIYELQNAMTDLDYKLEVKKGLSLPLLEHVKPMIVRKIPKKKK